MMRARHVQIPGALLLSLIIAGCGLTNPYANRTTRTPSAPAGTATTTVRNADPVPERDGTIPRRARKAQKQLGPSAASATPELALKQYALIYTNWTADTVAAAQQQLADMSLGSARAQALQAAVRYRHDQTLLASHIANHGTVVAITAGQGNAQGDWVVVTSEITTGQGDYAGLPAQLHITYAQATHTTTGWAVSSWTPET